MTYEEKEKFIKNMKLYESQAGFDQKLADLQIKIANSKDKVMKKLFADNIVGANREMLLAEEEELIAISDIIKELPLEKEKIEPKQVITLQEKQSDSAENKEINTVNNAIEEDLQSDFDVLDNKEQSKTDATKELNRMASKLIDEQIEAESEKIISDTKSANFESQTIVNDVMSKENKTKLVGSKNNSVLLASLFAALCALGGCAVWVIVFNLGFISGWIALLTIVFAGFGYKKIRGEIDKKGLVIISVITIAEILITILISYVFVVMGAGEGALSFAQSFEMLIDLLKTEPDVRSEFILNVLMSLVFTVIGVVFYIVNSKKQKFHINTKGDMKDENN